MHFEDHQALKSVLLFAIPVLLLGCAILPARRSATTALHKETCEPLFTFVQLNDTHIQDPARKPLPYEKCNEKVDHLVKSINAEKYFKLPDFVLLAGDIVNGGATFQRPSTKAEIANDLRVAKKILDGLKCPYHMVIGNHEYVGWSTNDAVYAGYEEVFGAGKINYTFPHKGVLFVCIDDFKDWGTEAGMTAARNVWLADVFKRYPDTPKIITGHFPVYCVRDEKVFLESIGLKINWMWGDSTRQFLKNNKSTVIAFLAGHNHLTGAIEVDGIQHIVVSGTASYPCDYAHYAVYPDHIDVTMYQMDGEYLTPKTSLHGPPRHKKGFTDSRHKTPEAYVKGNPDERAFTIPLPPAKRPRRDMKAP